MGNLFIHQTLAALAGVVVNEGLNRFGTFESPSNSIGRQLSFSPDDRFSTLFNRENLATWDLLASVPLGAIPPVLNLLFANAVSFTYNDGCGRIRSPEYVRRRQQPVYYPPAE